jgi:hypothetical protein
MKTFESQLMPEEAQTKTAGIQENSSVQDCLLFVFKQAQDLNGTSRSEVHAFFDADWFRVIVAHDVKTRRLVNAMVALTLWSNSTR